MVKSHLCPISGHVDPEDMRMYPSLETPRLILRRLTLDDAEALANAINHPKIAATTTNIPHPYNPDDARSWIESHLDDSITSDSLPFGLFLRESGELIGGAELSSIDKINLKAELGYWCAVDFWGRGYTTEAARAIVDYGFRELNLERIYARCFDINPASARVMEKIGMTFEGTARREYRKNDVFHDFRHYAILRDDWGGKSVSETLA